MIRLLFIQEGDKNSWFQGFSKFALNEEAVSKNAEKWLRQAEYDFSEIINFFKKSLKKKLKSVEVILFGSYAFGNPHSDSDIDLLVISPEFEKKSIIERGHGSNPIRI